MGANGETLGFRVNAAEPICTAELTKADTGELQTFFEDNPDYFLVCHGTPARPDEAATELQLNIPNDYAYDRQWLIGFRAQGERLIAVAHIVKDLFSAGVWHVGLFIVETGRHGNGDAPLIYAAIEAWAVNQGARWIRLGVVKDNVRASRFWEARGFLAVRERAEVAMGLKNNTLVTMVKTLGTSTLTQYLARVERDRS